MGEILRFVETWGLRVLGYHHPPSREAKKRTVRNRGGERDAAVDDKLIREKCKRADATEQNGVQDRREDVRKTDDDAHKRREFHVTLTKRAAGDVNPARAREKFGEEVDTQDDDKRNRAAKQGQLPTDCRKRAGKRGEKRRGQNHNVENQAVFQIGDEDDEKDERVNRRQRELGCHAEARREKSERERADDDDRRCAETVLYIRK